MTHLPLPGTVHLDREREVIVCVDSGRNSVNRISISLSDRGQKIAFDASRATGVEPSSKLSVTDCVFCADTHTLSRAHCRRRLDDRRPGLEGVHNYPHQSTDQWRPVTTRSRCSSSLSLLGHLKRLLTRSPQVDISAEYSSAKRPSLRRISRQTAAYTFALPLAVNVQDYFRKDWCVSPPVKITQPSQSSDTSPAQLALEILDHDGRDERPGSPVCQHRSTESGQGPSVPEGHQPPGGTFTPIPARQDDAHAARLLQAVSPLQTANFLFRLTCADPATIGGEVHRSGQSGVIC